MNIEPARLRELANGLRWRAGFIAVKKPIAQPERVATRGGAMQSAAYGRAEEVLQSLDKVVQYHVDRMQTVATQIDAAAKEYEEKDVGFAGDINRLEPR